MDIPRDAGGFGAAVEAGTAVTSKVLNQQVP
jgi:hypothetical protein